MATDSYARSISLPAVDMFHDLSDASSFAIDIGGSLTKIAYLSKVKRRTASICEDTNSTERIYAVDEKVEENYRLHFVKFENKFIGECLEFVQQALLDADREAQTIVKVTGGGAHKYRQLIEEKLGVKVDRLPEMECIISGCCFLLRHIRDELFTYSHRSEPPYQFTQATENTFPFVLVQIGSGVSIVKVEDFETFTRIGGSSLGGGTFLGLGTMLTDVQSFDELLQLASSGDHRHVDMLVSDIYGSSTESLGLPGDVIASSFGKTARSDDTSFEKADVARSLVITLSNNIGQIACLYAQLHQVKNIVFGGFFIRGDPFIMYTLTYAVNFWSRGNQQAMFLRHEGYLGAVGAFLHGTRGTSSEFSWKENYADSSGLSTSTDPFNRLSLDRTHRQLSVCPLLLDPAAYLPDVVDLSQDADARNYWLQTFLDSTTKFAERACASQPDSVDALERAESFRQKYASRLDTLRAKPCTFGSLTVRSLLDIREDCLIEHGFADPFLKQKREENESALVELGSLLEELDSLDVSDRILAVCRCLIAGNVFDWGARHVSDLLEKKELDFNRARDSIQARPWLFDDFDSFYSRMRNSPYRHVTIFCDNSGADVVLGVIPFCRELLRAGANKVILAANERPALNDITHEELVALMKCVRRQCKIIDDACAADKLLVMSNGQASPCLDLRCLDTELCEAMCGSDLVVLEGMGRAVHTNNELQLSADCLNVAVLKNRWLAQRLGGEMFSVVFRLKPAATGTSTASSTVPNEQR